VIPSYCKSAGTLFALGATELVMSDIGELGPLDIQLPRKDELGESYSGLTLFSALDALQEYVFNVFESYFLRLRGRSGFQISMRSCFDVAERIAIGLFAPVYSQIDPMRIGEMARATRIAQEYGQRLATRYGSVDSDSLARLLYGYPEHGFVIDRLEAKELFLSVREPNEHELKLIEVFGKLREDTTSQLSQGTFLKFEAYNIRNNNHSSISNSKEIKNEELERSHKGRASRKHSENGSASNNAETLQSLEVQAN